jgi:hypothetical protein
MEAIAIVIARSEATKQSSARQGSGLLRYARNDENGTVSIHAFAGMSGKYFNTLRN